MLPYSTHHTTRHHSHLDREGVCIFDEKGLYSEALAEHCSLVNSSQGYSLICVEAPGKVGPGRGERSGGEGRGGEGRGGRGGRHQGKERLTMSMSLPPGQRYLAHAHTHTYYTSHSTIFHYHYHLSTDDRLRNTRTTKKCDMHAHT